jgi:hypothetical protein
MVPFGMPERLAVIAALIVNRPLCLSCIAPRANEPSTADLEQKIDRIAGILTVHRALDRCQACGLRTMVVWIEQPE